MKAIQQLQFADKKVIVRVDFNVPVNPPSADRRSGSKIGDDFRIRAALPTIEYLLKNRAEQLILISHLGRPEGKKISQMSLAPVATKLASLLKIRAKSKEIDYNGFPAFEISEKIILLENIRFYPEEAMPAGRQEENNPKFAQKLASLANSPNGEAGLFVFDAFSSAHRNSASCTGIAKILSSAAGLLVQKEVNELTQLIINPEKPFVLVLGGAKIADKLPVIKNLYGKIDTLIVGGGIANNFLTARDIEIGKSICEEGLKKESAQIMTMLLDDPAKDIFIPQDVIVSQSREKAVKMRTILRSKVAKDDIIVDIGPKTIKMVEAKIKKAQTIFWNGTLGICEQPKFAKGTKLLAKSITDSQAKSILAGGDTVAAVDGFGLLDKFDFVSTGGGAALEFLAGKRLPVLEVLE